MAYRDLDVRQRHAIIRESVANGVHNLRDIEAMYDSSVEQLPEVEVHPQANGGSITSMKQTASSSLKLAAFTSTKLNPSLGHRFEEGGPKYKQSSEAYYDPQSDTVFAPDSVGEFWHHERFHARPNAEYLQKIAPYYENLNDSVLTSFGADLPFVKRNGDPGQYYSPEEIGARVAASLEMLKKAGITSVSKDFITKSRKNENQYGDNYRDLLHMYNDDILLDLFNQYAKGGSIHIAPSKRGTFTAAATKHGKSVQAFARQVLANKENYSPAMVKKANFARNFGGHRHDDGGYNWRTPVGSNRSYLQSVKENLQTGWEKIKDNPFVNMVFPVKEVSEGHTEAILPLVIPGGGGVAETYRLLSPAVREAMLMSETEFKALYGVGKDYINTLLRSGNTKAVERAEKILGSIKSNISNSPAVTKVRQELTDFLTSRLNRGDNWIKGLQVDNVQNTPVRLWSENAGKSAFNEAGLYTAPVVKNGGYGNVIVQDAADIPTIRHELGHSTLQMGMKDPYGFLENSEEFLPVVDKGLPVEFQQYYTVPDEVRTRYLGLGVEAMKRNLTPTQLYRNAMEYGPRYVNHDPDIVDLLTRYDKESVLNYLGNIHSDGGYLPGKVYDVNEQEYNRLKSLGYEIEIL